ncbi:isocitrate lyase/phosphoenolpyruvate mutase family protein [Arthrobacter sp. AZCC_0090]|uniref:isocitrate lyase/PEP mutase family protein n=1 Tax=Arthrobacter sp. AZCC_0090 TaxID=2735881 RepID=UPI001620D522|nr:isocitrate lyase/phosphoenolpyruvate mutase family protein [Arthrobacter sp. AZCC_0090]MBB6405629.1 2-methylisocitrate lyase-like PEP mutase family enzyme [Arthrobacter sp. AZCC_0090]
MTMHPELESKALRFHELHAAPHAPLVLVNAWDAASARMVEEAGATAVATSSSAISWSLGYQDGDHLPRQLAMEALSRIAKATRLPVTADIETGYGRIDEELRATVRAVLEAGAVGINIEDSAEQPLSEIAEQSRRIALIRQTADDAGVRLFINARTDTYWSGKFPDTAYEETLRRADAYRQAGADGIFVPGLTDLHILHELSRRISVPLNALAGLGSPSPGELHDAGVRRISIGGSTARAAYATVSRLAMEVLGDGNWSGLAGTLSYAEMDALFGGR